MLSVEGPNSWNISNKIRKVCQSNEKEKKKDAIPRYQHKSKYRRNPTRDFSYN